MLAKLEPQALRSNLVRAGLFLAGWELLKKEVEEKVRDFYLVGFDEKGLMYSSDYERKVLALHKSRFEASLLWLVATGALDGEQAERVRNLRKYRNEVAHELPKLLVEVGHDVNVAHIRDTKDILGILGRFWGRIEVETNADFDPGEVSYDGIQSGVMLLMEHLVAAAEDSVAPPEPS
jgi:hypothetical protein